MPGLRLAAALAACWLATASGAGADPRLAAANDWLYVLQPMAGATLADIAATDFDVVVLDYSADGSESGEFSSAEIAQLHATGKTVIAYLSIGEAESYRYYFDPAWIDQPFPDPDAPPWLGPTNPDWEGNYKVRYWQPAWQTVVLDYLDRIVDQGFDGVYLDIVDAYYYWSHEDVERTRSQARQDMVALVQAIAAHARTTRGVGDFLVVPQNAADMVWDDSEILDALGEAYLANVDAIGIEDLFYDELVAQPPAETAYREDALSQYLAAGLQVLVVDYVWDGVVPLGGANVDRYDSFQAKSLVAGYVPYAAVHDRELDAIVEVSTADGFAEPQPKPGGGGWIFGDGFESGGAGAWSGAVGSVP